MITAEELRTTLPEELITKLQAVPRELTRGFDADSLSARQLLDTLYDYHFDGQPENLAPDELRLSDAIDKSLSSRNPQVSLMATEAISFCRLVRNECLIGAAIKLESIIQIGEAMTQQNLELRAVPDCFR